MGVLSTMLVSVAELTNLVTIFAVVFCIFAMTMFILKNMVLLRAHGDDMGRPAGMRPTAAAMRVPRLRMTRVHIPFTFKLLDSTKTSYSEVQCAISSQVQYSLQAFWAVSIRELHVSLWRPWAELTEAAESHGALDKGFYRLTAVDVRNQSPHGERVVSLKPPQPPLSLGAPPRLSYPLVVFLLRYGDTDTVHPDETVALVNVVHLRDPVCPLPTSILAQYLKQANGQLSGLKQLYLATGDSIDADQTNASSSAHASPSLSLAEPVACAGASSGPLLCSDAPPSTAAMGPEQLCVVCQYFPLSRALLPCRHTCICAVCFGKLERCPMCRAPIGSYFTIRGEDYIPSPERPCGPREAKGGQGAHGNWIDAWNDRLTDFLGFR